MIGKVKILQTEEGKYKLKMLLILLAFILVGYFSCKLFTSHLASKASMINDAYVTLNNKAKKIEIEHAREVQSASYSKVEGLTAAIMQRDTETIKKYFSPIFHYESGEAYTKAQKKLVQDLGESNSFIYHYAKENSESNGSNQIDLFSTYSYLKDLKVYPLKKELKGYSYLVDFERYFYKNKADLDQLEALVPSHALVVCSVLEDDSTKKSVTYHVANVSAYEGY